jgi:hypothetical protein
MVLTVNEIYRLYPMRLDWLLMSVEYLLQNTRFWCDRLIHGRQTKLIHLTKTHLCN